MISSRTLLAQRACLWVSVGVLLIRNASVIFESTFVLLMASVFDLPVIVVDGSDLVEKAAGVTTSSSPSSLAAACGVLLILLAVSDIPVMALNSAYLEAFSTIIPLRLSIYFMLVAYGYFYPSTSLACSPFFAFAFAEVVLHFLIFLTIRNERNDTLKTIIRNNTTSENEI